MRWFWIGLAMAVTASAARPAVAASPAQLCEADQLKAAAGLCKANFMCVSKFAKKPTKDPFLDNLSSCWSKGDLRFLKRWSQALPRAVQRGGSCALDDSPIDILNALNLATDEVIIRDPVDPGADVLSAWIGIEKDENRLHADILKAGARYCDKLFKAGSRDAKKPDATKLATARAKSLTKFLGRMDKAENRGLSKGWDYLGLPDGPLADAIEAIVDGLAADAAPPTSGSFQVTGTLFPADASFADSDVNDPNSPFTANNDAIDETPPSAADQALAQPLPVPAAVGGFVNRPGFGAPGRLQASGDLSDYFRVSFTAGQVITLQLEPQFGDLDLFLYDDTGATVDMSVGEIEFEMLVVPFSGEYFVEVYAYAGSSAYLLNLGQPVPAAMAQPRAPRLSDDFVPGELVVAMEPAAEVVQGRGLAAASAALTQDLGMRTLGGAPDREMLFALARDESTRARMFDAPDAGRSKPSETVRGAPSSLSPEDALKFDTLYARKAMRRRPDVATADLNHILQPLFTPNDEFYGFQWHYPLMNLPQAWDVTLGSSSVIVGVIDTGVLLAHPDLAGQLVPGYDFISNAFSAADGNGIDPDPNDVGDGGGSVSSSFHGTHVAGTIAAATGNSIGVAGVAGDARVMPLRVLGIGGGTGYDIIQAVRFSARLSNDSGTLPASAADVINLSLGGGGFSQTAQNTYNLARAQDVIVVAAAGNDNTSAPSYPAAYDGVVSVSAVDLNKNKTPYSNFGNRVDVAAPGGDSSVDRNGDSYVDGVLSTLGDDAGDFFYAFYQGTSMAAPHMAGVAALMKTVAPTMLDPASFDSLLATGAMTQDLGAAGRDDIYGHGLIDAAAAVQAAQDLEDGNPPVLDPVLVANPTALNFGSQLTALNVEILNAGDGSIGTVTTSDDAPWLSVSPVSVDGDGLGTYQVSVDRGVLSDGTYSGTVTFMSTPNDVNVGVVMRVGAAAASSMGTLYVILTDPDTGQTLFQDDVSQIGDGSYPFSFPGVPVADYLLRASTDVDNDFALCHTGEACGGYPTLDFQTEVRVDSNRSDLDFTAAFRQSVRSAADGEPLPRSPQGPWRLPTPLLDPARGPGARHESAPDQGTRSSATSLSRQP